MITEEQYMKYMKQREAEASQFSEEWEMECMEEAKREREIKEAAAAAGREAAKEYIDANKRRFEIELDKRSIYKALDEIKNAF